MPISDDWDFNYSAKVISHIDGVLSYGTGTGTQPAVGEYIIDDEGNVGKILARTGTVTTGTFTLTNVIGYIKSGAVLDHLSSLDFDSVSNGGFKVGDTIVDQVTGTMDVKFIEYNIGGTAGQGTAYGTNFTAFTNASQIDISGGTADVAAAVGTGTDNDVAFDATTTAAIAVPGTTNTNNSVIVHYDAGTIAIPEDAHIADTTGLTGAEGYAQRVYGSTTIGSIRVVDSDTTGAGWVDNNSLYIHDVEYYDTLVAGKVFSEGDVIKGATSGYEARIIAVIEDTGTTGKIILAGNTGTPWTDTEAIQVRQPDDTYDTYANVASGQNSYLDAADVNIPNGVRAIQREDQGGIYGASLNVVRSSNALYSYAQDLFDELAQLDDDPAFEGNVRDQLYTILNSYVIPDLSFRFLEKGSFRDSGNNNVFTNIQTTGAIADIGDHGFFYDTSNPTPQPDMYIEQDGVVNRQDWLEGNLDVLLKVKTSTDPAYINPTVESLGQLINGGAFTVHLRPYRRTFDSNEVTQQGGIAVVALGNANDLNNTTAQYSATQTGGTGTFTLGEEATTTGGKRVVIMNAATGGSGAITWANKGATNLVATDAITGSVSGATSTIGVVTDVVAGYDTDIRVMTVQRRFTGGTTTGTFVLGELITQTGGGTGYFMEDDGGTIYIEEQDDTTPFTATGLLTGGNSGATNTPTGTAAFSTVPKDIGGGIGDKNYTAVVSADITRTVDLTPVNPQGVAEVYEWWKFVTSRESSYQVNQPGLTADDYWLGKVYRRLDGTFAEVRGASPFGTKAGALVIGAQGVYIERLYLDSADIRNIQLIDNLGDTYDPPNVQTLTVSNVFSGVNVAVYRSTGTGNADILRTEFQVGVVGGTDNGTGDSDVLVQAGTRSVSPLPSDVPDTGVLRILDPADTGNYLRYPYTSVDRANNRFNLQGTLSSDLVQGDNVHVVFIEQTAGGTSVSNNIQYIGDIPLFARARIKGKQPFETTTDFGSGGANIGAVLNPDNVVNLP